MKEEAMSQIKMDCHGLTQRGGNHKLNEDQYLIADLVKAVRIQSTSLNYDDRSEVSGYSQGKLLLVADGMGDRSAGQRASTIAVDETINFMVNRMRWYNLNRASATPEDFESLSEDLKNALEHCQFRIWNESRWNSDRRGMGTTLTVSIVDWPKLLVVHAGDSRCYLDDQNGLKQISRDHTLTQAIMDASRIPLIGADKVPADKQVWNVVGGISTELRPEVYQADLKAGDTLLLCTDGLTKQVPDATIAEILKEDWSAKQTCNILLDLAKSSGGDDNVTVLVAKFVDGNEDALQASQSAELEIPLGSDTSGNRSEQSVALESRSAAKQIVSAIPRS